MSDDTSILPGLSPVCGLDVHARFDGGRISSNGEALMLREAGRGLGLAEMLASRIEDRRDPAKTTHSDASMIQARIVAIACGHEDCDDLDVLRHDPVLMMTGDKAPEAAVGLASQPTLSRLENTVSWRTLARMGLAMIATFCDSFERPPRQIVLDIDDTTDLVHGGQQLSLFSTPAGGSCFQPILIFEAATQKPVAAILRPGKRPSGEEAAQVLRHVVRQVRAHQIRAHWPRVAITVRGDAHYETPEVMDVLEDLGCFYIFGRSGNKRLAGISAPWRDDVATRRAPVVCINSFALAQFTSRVRSCHVFCEIRRMDWYGSQAVSGMVIGDRPPQPGAATANRSRVPGRHGDVSVAGCH